MTQVHQEAKLSHLLQDNFVPGTTDVSIADVSLHADQVASGGLFLACAGGQHHGLDFLQQAIAAGAVAVVWEPVANMRCADMPIVNVPVADLRRRVSDIAARFFGSPSEQIRVVGVTGTNGKTSTVKLIADALERLGQPCGVLGTLGVGRPGNIEAGNLTTPDAVTIQRVLAEFRNSGTQHVAMEVSSHGLVQHRVTGVRFNTAVFTNLSRDHLDYHGDMESYAVAKSKLFALPGLEAAVVNLSDDYGKEIWNELPESVRPIGVWWGDAKAHAAQAYVCITALSTTPAGLSLTFESSWGNGTIDSALLGRFNGLNLVCAAAVLLEWGFGLDQTIAALNASSPVPGRMESLNLPGKPLVVVDYSHTPDALEKALQAVREHCGGKVRVVFGCGGERDRGKRPVMGAIAARYADALFVTDDNPRNENPEAITRDILAGIPKDTNWVVEHDRSKAIIDAINASGSGDVVLLAGKGHETYQIRGDERVVFDDREHACQTLTRGGRA